METLNEAQQTALKSFDASIKDMGQASINSDLKKMVNAIYNARQTFLETLPFILSPEEVVSYYWSPEKGSKFTATTELDHSLLFLIRELYRLEAVDTIEEWANYLDGFDSIIRFVLRHKA